MTPKTRIGLVLVAAALFTAPSFPQSSGQKTVPQELQEMKQQREEQQREQAQQQREQRERQARIDNCQSRAQEQYNECRQSNPDGSCTMETCE